MNITSPILALPLIIHSAFVQHWLSSDNRSPPRFPLLPARTLGNIREYYTQELTLQITLPGLGPAYTPPSLGQDNPGSSTGYMPLIIKKVQGMQREWGGRKERWGRPWGRLSEEEEPSKTERKRRRGDLDQQHDLNIFIVNICSTTLNHSLILFLSHKASALRMGVNITHIPGPVLLVSVFQPAEVSSWAPPPPPPASQKLTCTHTKQHKLLIDILFSDYRTVPNVD